MWAKVAKSVGKVILVVVVEEGGRQVVKYVKKKLK